jgi:hypothetical protein
MPPSIFYAYSKPAPSDETKVENWVAIIWSFYHEK